MALPNTDHNSIKQLLSSVHEGLQYVEEVDKQLDENKELRNTRKEAKFVWVGVSVFSKWLNMDLRKMALQETNEKEVLEKLSNRAKNKFTESINDDLLHMKGYLREVPSRWHPDTLAANSEYRICQTLLLNYTSSDYGRSDKLFDKVHVTICGILRACVTNLHHVISKQCHHSRIEGRLESVQNVVLLFGRSEKILKIVDRQ